jgi:hypothetical protein
MCRRHEIAHFARSIAFVLIGLAPQCAATGEPLSTTRQPGPLRAQADIQSLPVPRLPEAQAPPAPEDCGDRPHFSEDDGLVTLDIVNPCRRGAAIDVSADGMKLRANFNGAGLAEFAFPIFHEHTEIAWQRADGKLDKTAVAYSGFKDAVRIALVWRSHVALALHVIEPGAEIGGVAGHVRVDPLASKGASTLGADETSMSDTDPFGNLEVYSLPSAGNPGKGLLSYFVEFVSRGETPSGLFCGDGAFASPEFEIWILRYGALEKLQRSIAPAPCGKPLSEKIRIQRIGDVSLAHG